MTMQTDRDSSGRWVPCDSRSALLAQLPQNASELLLTDNPNSWGYIAFDSDTIIPIGYAGLGLFPVTVRLGNRIFVGIDELLVGYELPNRSVLFKYSMPTVFHEFVRFEEDGLIARDEIGFVGISYVGEERWTFCIDVIASYEINQSTILGKTEDGESFKFTIPSEKSPSHQPSVGSS